MSRSVPLGRIPLHLLILTFLLVLVCIAGLPGRAVASGDGQSDASDYLNARVHVIDPPAIEPGDDDQPTIVARKRSRQVQVSSEPGGQSSSGGGAAQVNTPRPGIWASWTEMFRAYVGRLGMLLRMPS